MSQDFIVKNLGDRRFDAFMDMGVGDVDGYMAGMLDHFEIVGDELVPVDMDSIRKAAFTSADTGTFAYMYGAVATLQVTRNQNTIASIPKRGYERNGFRARSAQHQTSGTGSTEGSTLPTSTQSTYNEIDVGLKDLVVTTEQSFRWKVIIDKNDAITFDGMAKDWVDDFWTATNADVLGDIDTTANLNMESLDRYTQASTARAAIGYTDGDEDLYAVDRSTSTYFNGNVYHNSDTDRELEKAHIDQLKKDAYQYWGGNHSNKFYHMGYDIYVGLSWLEGAKQRLSDVTAITSFGAGVTPTPGVAGGFKINTYDTHPIIIDDAIQDTGRRAYFLDYDTVGIATGRPLEIIRGDNIVYLDAVKMRQAIYWIAELWGTLPKASAQLRDIATNW